MHFVGSVVLLTLAGGLVGGCYDPELREGGFICDRTGECPEGFTCFEEDRHKVCRMSKALDGRTAVDGGKDLSGMDLPMKDLPSKDLPSKDLPSKDLPSKDLPSKDLPMKDLPSKDLPSKDAGGDMKGETAMDAHIGGFDAGLDGGSDL